MRLVSFDDDRVGRLHDGQIVDVTTLLGESGTAGAMRRLIADWDRIADGVVTHQGPSIPLEQVRLRAPVADPSKILAAPINYVDHQSEMSSGSDVSHLGLFLKSPSSVLDPNGTIRLPYLDRRFDQEGELAVVVGRYAYRIESDPLDYVFGYTGLLDITMRGGEDRSTRKSFATFTPLGPWIVTPEEFGDPAAVDLCCTVDGRVRQQANTRDLIWSVAQLVEYASWISPLYPGDIITTGTPAGVDELCDGDTVELVLSGLGGPLTASVSSQGAVPSHTLGKDRGPKPPPSSRDRR